MKILGNAQVTRAIMNLEDEVKYLRVAIRLLRDDFEASQQKPAPRRRGTRTGSVKPGDQSSFGDTND